MSSASEFLVVIPARHASTRLPGKPLADIAGKPMVVRVAERARQSGSARVWVATDHPDVAEAARAEGVDVCMTSPDCASGTDRLAEVAERLGWPDEAVVVNVQGDEPLIDPALIDGVAHALAAHPSDAMSTAAHAIHDADDFANPHVVKVVCTADSRALYFSRAPIPHWRDAPTGQRLSADLTPLRHVGLYAYRAAFLRRFPTLPAAPVERVEALEQLRALWHGASIRVVITESAPAPGVDTPADLARVRAILAAPNQPAA